MTFAERRRSATRAIVLDRALEVLPLFRLSDSADEGALQYAPAEGGRWRVLPAPGDRLPGTFDQDVYVELMRRWSEAGCPEDGTLTFTLHNFLRSIGRKADGRTYEQLRAALGRLERTLLESTGAWHSAAAGALVDARFTVLSGVVIERRRTEDREQLGLFPNFTAHEPGDARVTLSPALRTNLTAGHVCAIAWTRYQQLASPVARRLYRLLSALRADDVARAAIGAAEPLRWRAPLERWAERLPLTQRYPSHLQRVLQPAHEMLLAAGAVRSAGFVQEGRDWWVEYEVTAGRAAAERAEADRADPSPDDGPTAG